MLVIKKEGVKVWNNIKIIRKIKSMLPLGLKLVIIRILVVVQYTFYAVFPRKIQGIDKSKNKIFVLLSTDYSNLGDHAMTYAHIKLLKAKYPSAQIVEVLVGDTLKNIRHIASIIEPNDVITLKGGGNVGLEYFREELYRRILIKKFNKNKIILFPQTVYFPETSKGKREFNNTLKIFKKHSQFYAFLRDEISYNMVKKHLKERAFLVPDTVLSLSNLEMNEERQGATICIRCDKEGIYNKEQKNIVEEISKKYFKTINITDTVTDYPIPIKIRKKELYSIWKTFSSSKLIITDRLHGMIFSAITSTPCIVLRTYNHKLVGQYKWLKHLNYIKLVKLEKEELESAIKELMNIKVIPYDALMYGQLYNKIIEAIEIEAVN